MVVICPNCHSKFKINKGVLVKKTVKMRCSACSHIFSYTQESEPTLEQEFDSIIAEKSSLPENLEPEALAEDQDFGMTETAPEEVPEEESAPPEEEEQPESVMREIDSILGAGGEVGRGNGEKIRRPGKSTTPRRVIMSVLVLLLVFASVAVWLMKDRIPFLKENQEELQQAVLERGPFFTIPDESVTYEMLTNHQEGSVLVIKGVIKKLTGKPLESVMVQARVYDTAGKLIETRNAYAGIVPDPSELMQQKSTDINSLLSAEPSTMGALSSSPDIPFAVAFFGRTALDGVSFQVEVKEFHWR